MILRNIGGRKLIITQNSGNLDCCWFGVIAFDTYLYRQEPTEANLACLLNIVYAVD
jgi:hypothetical protein